jgi:hypothetical protein
VKESLEREIHPFRDEMREGFAAVNTRFDNQAARMDRQAAPIQTGSRQIVRFDEWADKVDRALDAKDRQIMELMDRIRRLEEKRNGGG